jgi:hypothetical protein
VDVPSTVTVVGGVLVIATTIAAAARYITRSIGKLADRWENINTDLYGEPARMGRPAIEGVLDRLGKVEAGQRDQVLRVGALEERLDGWAWPRGRGNPY